MYEWENALDNLCKPQWNEEDCLDLRLENGLRSHLI